MGYLGVSGVNINGFRLLSSPFYPSASPCGPTSASIASALCKTLVFGRGQGGGWRWRSGRWRGKHRVLDGVRVFDELLELRGGRGDEDARQAEHDSKRKEAGADHGRRAMGKSWPVPDKKGFANKSTAKAGILSISFVF